MRTASWVLLTIVGVLMLLASVGSAFIAYKNTGSDSIHELRPDSTVLSPEVKTLLLGRRGTAAAFAGTFATLLLTVVLVPYRRGDVWAWWAILGSLVVLNLLTVPRIFYLGTKLGIVAHALPLGIGLVALLLDVKRLRRA